jgi:hypothetical protein
MVCGKKWDDFHGYKINVKGNYLNTSLAFAPGNKMFGVNDGEIFLEKGKWYHYVFTFDGSHHRLYRNGKIITELPGPSPSILYDDYDLKIGISDDGKAWPFTGALDEIMIFSRALTEDEISSLHGTYKFNQPPRIYSVPENAVGVGQLFKYEIQAVSGEEGQHLKYLLKKGPAGMKITGNVLTWKAGKAAQTPYDIGLQVCDNDGACGSQDFKLALLDPKEQLLKTPARIKQKLKKIKSLSEVFKEHKVVNLENKLEPPINSIMKAGALKQGIVVIGANLVADGKGIYTGNRTVALFDNTGKLVRQLTCKEMELGHFGVNMPVNVFTEDSRVAVLCAKSPNRLFYYNNSGEYLNKIEIPSRKSDIFYNDAIKMYYCPQQDDVHIMDGPGAVRGNVRVQVFDDKGKLVNSFAQVEDLKDSLRFPQSGKKRVCFDANGNCWLANDFNPVISIYSKEGYFIKQIDISGGGDDFTWESDFKDVKVSSRYSRPSLKGKETLKKMKRIAEILNSKKSITRLMNIDNKFILAGTYKSAGDSQKGKKGIISWIILSMDGQILNKAVHDISGPGPTEYNTESILSSLLYQSRDTIVLGMGKINFGFNIIKDPKKDVTGPPEIRLKLLKCVL